MILTRLHVRGRDIGVRVSITETARERMRGLLDHDRLPHDEALLLKRCGSVHTFGMRFAIDVLFLDRQRRIVAIRHNVPKRRMLFSLRATQTLEMPAGIARLHGLELGDILDFEAIR
ncbi:DUF192 domain-containing protein [Paraburkholderia aspalathi]|uniref:DUF192 domain-containing protein n=1 Tax=Paraburkholderia aspalathi TaxID=1324617 RepID=UPI001B015736|nr:DUF192 domain-containing protein [Paraburkholderia aspalathi]CAE6695234.1 hypothetical protein R20943_00264 [Paraburkholderia aspalathi]